MIIEAILKINPSAVVTVRGNDLDTCTIEWLEDTSPISKADIKSTMDQMEVDLANEKQAKEDLKASAKAKLIAGEPLTAEEADTIVL